MEIEKIELILKVLENTTLKEWNILKNEIDIAYREVEYSKVPNTQLGTLRENLVHELKL